MVSMVTTQREKGKREVDTERGREDEEGRLDVKTNSRRAFDTRSRYEEGRKHRYMDREIERYIDNGWMGEKGETSWQ